MPRHLRPVMPTGGVPPISKKRAQFLKVAEPRLSAVLFEIEKLAMTADRNRHEIYDSDVEMIEERINASVKDLLERFRTGRRKPLVEFTRIPPEDG